MLLHKKKKHCKFKKHYKFKKHLPKIGAFGFKVFLFTKFTISQHLYLKKYIFKILKKFFYKKKLKILFYFHFNQTETKLSLESRMGKGKGDITNYFEFLKKNSILFEIIDMKIEEAIELKEKINKSNIINLELITKKCF